MAKEKKKRLGLWITLGIVGFVLLLLIGSLVFVEISINDLSSSLDTKKVEVVGAFEARSKVSDKLINTFKIKMSQDPNDLKKLQDAFAKLEVAEKKLKKANDVKALSDANLEVDTAIDNLIFVMRDSYYYYETPDVLTMEEEMDSARSRIVIEYTDYNDVAKEYNYVIENFPGDFLSNIFGHENSETFQIVDYKDITR